MGGTTIVSRINKIVTDQKELLDQVKKLSNQLNAVQTYQIKQEGEIRWLKEKIRVASQ